MHSMAYESYQMMQNVTSANPRERMLEEKKEQISSLYELAVDREDTALLNGKLFVKSPRLFNRKIKNHLYQTVTMETIDPLDKFYSGDIIAYDNDQWLCLNSYDFHGLYHRGQLDKCNFVLRWRNEKGVILESLGIFQDASQLSEGEFEGEIISALDFKLNVLIPLTEDSMKLVESKSRFILMDKIWQGLILDNDNPISTWKLTKKNDITYSYKDKGLIGLTLTKTTFNKNTDDVLLRLCDVLNLPIETPTPNINGIHCIISCTRPSFNNNVKLNTNYHFKTVFTNLDGDIMSNIVPQYHLVSEFDNILNFSVNDEIASVSVNEDLGIDYIGRNFKLVCEDDLLGYSNSITLNIISKY
jgi:hypothetical protein